MTQNPRFNPQKSMKGDRIELESENKAQNVEKAKNMTQKNNENIKYEQITIQVPKQVMDFLRFHESLLWCKDVTKYIEHSVLQTVAADADAGAYDRPVIDLIDKLLGK